MTGYLKRRVWPAGAELALWVFLFAAALGVCGAADTRYLPDGTPDSAIILAPFPLPGSAEQAADLAEVTAVHRACSSNELATAMAGQKFTVFNFTPAIGPFFQPGKFPKTEAFFNHVQKDASIVTGVAKDYWRRPRPFMVDPSLASTKLETSFSYPSGHSTESAVLALVLGDLFPEQKDEILAISRDIGWHRVEIAHHYPTDIYAGRVFARAIVREMRANADFQRDFAEVRSELAAARRNAVTAPAGR